MIWESWENAQAMQRFLFYSRRGRHTRFDGDWSSDVCSPDPLRRGHEKWHADADRREDDVERERHGHLGAGEDEVGHWARSLKMIVRPNTKNSVAAARRIQTDRKSVV